MVARKFAVFDIDGTLIRWQLYHALADELAGSGLIDSDSYREVMAARANWKNRLTNSAFRDYEDLLVKLINASIISIKVEELNTACDRVIDVYKDQVYTYTRNNIKQLKAEGYLLFAISTSQEEIVARIADYYKFDGYGGTFNESIDGQYTGKQVVLIGERKALVLKKLVAEHQATWKGSIGIGDSEGDIPYLTIVETPIAFNPTRELFEHAKNQAWKIVLERKNVIYELESSRGKYQLVG
jgi:HAD superfamily hydrolase (TIGR01490 family)